MSHVTIIGSGIAAIAAAIEAESHGAEVTIIRGRPGATALFSGAWDIAGRFDRHPSTPWEQATSAEEALKQILRRLPDHPYNLLAKTEAGDDLFQYLQKKIEQVGSKIDLKLLGSKTDFKLREDSDLLLLNPLGGVKRTSLVHQNHSAGNILKMKSAKLLIVGFRGLPTFHARQVGKLLEETYQRQGNGQIEKIDMIDITLKGIPAAISPIEMARRLDEDSIIDTLHQALIHEVEKFKPTHVALPPVIGIQKTDHILSRLMEVSEIAWFETLALPPSLPGLRLQRKIDNFLDSNSGKNLSVIDGWVVGGKKKRGKVTTIKVIQKGKEKELPVDRLLLTTGRFISGGIIKERELREPILNLPIFCDTPPLGEKFLEDHPLFSAGVRTNRQLQPVDDRGTLVFGNVWVAGSLIGGYNPTVQHCGMGVAVGTGEMAGRLAVS